MHGRKHARTKRESMYVCVWMNIRRPNAIFLRFFSVIPLRNKRASWPMCLQAKAKLKKKKKPWRGHWGWSKGTFTCIGGVMLATHFWHHSMQSFCINICSDCCVHKTWRTRCARICMKGLHAQRKIRTRKFL